MQELEYKKKSKPIFSCTNDRKNSVGTEILFPEIEKSSQTQHQPLSQRGAEAGEESLFLDGNAPQVRRQFFENIKLNKGVLIPTN